MEYAGDPPGLDQLLDGPRLVPGEAAAALLVTADGRYLLQHRDPLPGIFFPGWWGLFGGALEPGESPETALRRELQEELRLSPSTIGPFCTLGLDFSFAGLGPAERHIFVVPIDRADLNSMVLGDRYDSQIQIQPDGSMSTATSPYHPISMNH